MKKELASKFAFLSGCCITVFSEEDEVPSVGKLQTDIDSILDEIFSVDPVTGAPKGDISYYLTANGNPQVKDWIQRNLLQPRSVLTGADPSKISDDLISEFSRRSGESNEAYASRLVSIRTEAEENLKKFEEQNVELFMRHLYDSPIGATPFNRGAPKNIAPAFAAALPSIVTAGGNLIGGAINNIVNRSNMEKQLEYSKELAKFQWDNFQSYPAQVQSMTKAGLNPSVMFGQSGASSASPSINMPTSYPVDFGLDSNSIAQAIKTIAEAKKTGLEGVAQGLENEVLSVTQKERIGTICQQFRYSAAQAEKTERECSQIEGLNTKLQQEIDLLRKQNVRFDWENDVFQQKLKKELRKYDDEHNLNYWQYQQIEQTLPTVVNKLNAEERILNVEADIEEDFKRTQASLGVVGDVLKILLRLAGKYR